MCPALAAVYDRGRVAPGFIFISHFNSRISADDEVHMSAITTRRGDGGMTGTYSGERVPKHHIVTETVGSLDEANSLLGLARASVEEKKTKRIIRQVQKHLLVVSAEVSCLNKSRVPRGGITELEVDWLERLVDDLEDELSLPPGFVVFGQQRTASQLDVARTGIRKAERLVSRMLSEGIIENRNLLRYLNRLSDLVFLLACLAEKGEAEQERTPGRLGAPLASGAGRLTVLLGAVSFMLVVAVVLLVLFHGRGGGAYDAPLADHLSAMESMHR